jgi:uncharacterized protein YggE
MPAHRAALLFALTMTAVPVAAQDPARPVPTIPTIVTVGNALVRRAPDLAVVTAAVESRAKVPRDAQRQNAETMTAVQQRVAGLGISREAMRTLGYSIQQEVDFVNGRRVPRDYAARNALEIRVENLERLGEVLDAAVNAGATSVGDVRFDLRDRAAAEREALRLAVEDARARADAAAAGARRSVDSVLKIEDGLQPAPPPRPMMMAAPPRAAAVETPIEPGTIEIRAQVTLTVTIK